MSVEQHSEEMIFKAAIKLHPSAERVAFIKQACGCDVELLARLETLLRAHDEAGDFLETPPFGSGVALDFPPVAEGPGTVIGRYKLLEKIGEGGMAVVYMAEQTEPIRRKVALKIIKLGMDTRQVIARFEAERQALALMDHPGIAKVLDAGATETGRPYFVMELVQGVSITEYCDKNSLSTKDRLALFLQVCQAVQHAHQKGIIHRDIKPSNVMVTHHDGKPVPKVIDFGIAKATDQKLTEKTLFTRYAHIIGTPAYMSPEQAELSDLDIDTRSDIYSLGVLLYELLTGTTPFSEEDLRRAGYVEMQRVIREQEPLKPSTRIRTATRERRSVGAGPRACPTSGGHGGPPLREVRGDLDWIVMKSLEKDRVRRYETASGLAEDIRRHLEHEPIVARGPSTAYRLRKFLRRHRVQALVSLTVAALIAAVAVALSIWNQDRLQWNRDRLQLAQAERLQHEDLLDRARDQHAKAEREAALRTIQPILQSQYVGPEAQLLRAAILVDNRRPDEATTILKNLLGERREIAGAAHALLARILWETGPLEAEKLKEFEVHRRQAEALLPETAEAYFLRAMTAVTVKQQLAALDQALQLDAYHYESLRLRAFTYYASRKYDRLREDARAMTILRRGDPLGYSLRAVALREAGQYGDAIAAYDNALTRTPKQDPAYADLVVQRSEVLLRWGQYDRVLTETQAHPSQATAQALSPLQYHRFAAWTALGDYDRALDVSEQVGDPGPEARQQFRTWCAKYVFDTLRAGRSWHPPEREPVGAAFLSLVEAQEVYHDLSAKGQRVTSDGFSARWSPDGSKLAFTLGVHGSSGVAVFDIATKETDLLIVPGKLPRWSPDGQYLAFVRDREFLPIAELVAAPRKDQPYAHTDEEVWLMKSDGTEPRRVARGGWPSWSRDSTHIYYQSPADRIVYSIPIVGTNVEPKQVMVCPGFCPSVSPDEKYVAYTEVSGFLKVQDLASRALVAAWSLPLPAGMWTGPVWAPGGDELYLGGSGGLDGRTGLWIYRLGGGEPVTTLRGSIMAGAWTLDRTKLVFELGTPGFEIWTADLDPRASSTAALGPARSLREHFRDLIAFYTRRIDADPAEATSYIRRAELYQQLQEEASVRADMRRHVATLKQGFSSSVRLGGPWAFMRVVKGPLGYQLVVFLERQEDGMQVLRIAFGQKGRCEMKMLEIPMVATSLFGLCLLSGLDAPAAHADFTFGSPTNLGPAINTSGDDAGPCLSPDGLEFYFSRLVGNICEIWVARRATPDSEWGLASRLGPPIGPDDAGEPFFTSDGLSLYFDGTRPGGYGDWDLWMTTRATVKDNWGTPVNLGATVNSAYQDWAPSLTADGLELYFTSNRPGGSGGWDVWVTTRATIHDAWGVPVNLGPTINTSAQDNWPGISPDGLVLFFGSSRPGGSGSWEIYMARRSTRNAPWGPPVNVGPVVNSSVFEVGTRVSPDGSMLFFQSPRAGGYGATDVWQAPIIPILDFNGDGKVDAKDMGLLADNWGKNTSLCDIGPFPWGNGVVDEKDLGILLESLVTPCPRASDVPCDAVLSWVSPSFANACDVYFGTSQETVNTADRANPQGMLVSQGQTATTYNPPGILDLSRTYYWRVDFVSADSVPITRRGPVLEFTTAGLTYPIKNITAKASSAQAGSGPERTVNGSGLDKTDGHSTDQKDMWWSQGAAPHWIQYEFDQVYALHEMWVWNFNTIVEPFMGFGAKTVKIEYSVDGTTWTPLANVPEFARAPGKPGYTANTIVSFAGVPAKFVKLTIEKNWGVAPQTGLSEVRFFCIQSAAVPKP